MPTRWRSGDDARCAARAEVCETGPPRKACRANPSRRAAPRARRRAHETRRRKTWVGEPSNNHTETKKKTPVWLVVGRGDRSTRARPVDRVRSPRRHRDGRRSRDDRAGLTRSLRRARSPSRALRCDGRATRVSRHGARGAPGQGGDDARFHTLATAHDAALAELAATLRAPERYDWRDGRAAFDGGAPTVGGAAFDARRADAPGETSGRATPSTSPSTSPTPSTRAHATSRPHVDTSPPAVPTLEARARLRPPARARSAPPSRRAIVSLAVNARGFVAAAALDGGVVVWHVPSGRLVDAFRFDDASEREANRQKKPRDAPRASDVWWIGGGGDDDENVDGDDALLAAAEDGTLALRRLEPEEPRLEPEEPRLEPGPISSARPLFHLVGHVARVTAACWTSTDGGETTTLCTASLDATARTWRLERGDASPTSDPSDPSISATPVATPVATLRGHEAGLTCACVSARRSRRDARGEFRLWRLPNGDPTTTVRWGSDGDAILRCAFLPRGRKPSPRRSTATANPFVSPPRTTLARTTAVAFSCGVSATATIPSREFAATKPRFREAVEPSPEESSTRAPPARRRTKREHAARDDASSEGNDSDSSDDSDSSEDTDVLLACGSTGWVTGCDAASARTLYSFEEKCDRTVAGGFERTTGGVRRCALSPDGGAFATLRADGGVCVRRTSDGELVAKGKFRRGENPSAVGVGGDAGGGRSHGARAGDISSAGGMTGTRSCGRCLERKRRGGDGEGRDAAGRSPRGLGVPLRGSAADGGVSAADIFRADCLAEC